MATRKKSTTKKATARKATTRKATTRKATARKATARKATTRKATTRKATTRKATAKKAVVKTVPLKTIKVKQTQAQIVTDVSECCGENKQTVKNVLEALKMQIRRHVRQGGSGEMMLPGIGIKVKRFKKKATKARMGVNPFTGETMKIKAKPASMGVRARALKALKELAQ